MKHPSRRQFVKASSLSLLGAAVAPALGAQQASAPPPGQPPAFGTAPAVGPQVSADTFAEAEKLVRVGISPAHQAEAAQNWREAMAPLYERRTAPAVSRSPTATPPGPPSAPRSPARTVPDAWPNTFRQSRFLSAVDFVQADRMRRLVAAQMARIFSQVDLLLVPSLRDETLTIGNFTGHPALALRAGFVEVSEAHSNWAPNPAHPLPRFSPPRRVPHGITLLAPPFQEGRLGTAGIALERAFAVADQRPPGF